MDNNEVSFIKLICKSFDFSYQQWSLELKIMLKNWTQKK